MQVAGANPPQKIRAGPRASETLQLIPRRIRDHPWGHSPLKDDPFHPSLTVSGCLLLMKNKQNRDQRQDALS